MKRTVAALAAILLVFSLAACGKISLEGTAWTTKEVRGSSEEMVALLEYAITQVVFESGGSGYFAKEDDAMRFAYSLKGKRLQIVIADTDTAYRGIVSRDAIELEMSGFIFLFERE